MRKTSRRRFMVLGGLLVGAGTVGKEIASDVSEESNEEPNPELDATDITITDVSLNVYKHSENDWDAEVSVDVRNEGRRGYVVTMPVYIVDEEGNQLDNEKTFEFRVGPNDWFEGSKKWNDTDSKVRGGEEVVVEQVKVQSRKFLKSGFTDTVQDTEKVIENEE